MPKARALWRSSSTYWFCPAEPISAESRWVKRKLTTIVVLILNSQQDDWSAFRDLILLDETNDPVPLEGQKVCI